MNGYELNLDKQREQLVQVIDYLKNKGIKQKDIVAQIGLDSIYLSQVCSGKRREITKDLVENLHEEFNINPDFIYYGSDCIIDIPQLQFENFEKFVKEWELVEHEGKSYLYFTMDENFYNFLLKVYDLKESLALKNSQEMTDVYLEAFKSLKRQYSSNPKYKKYVLIPEDDIIEIAGENVDKRKSLAEVIDILGIEY